MDTHLTDFPIEPGRVVLAGRSLPADISRIAGVDETTLVQVLAALGQEHIGELRLRPSLTEYQTPLEPLFSGEDVTDSDVWESFHSVSLPKIVAMRFNGRRLRKVRRELGYTQERLAKEIRDAGARLGEPNRCTKRNLQKWENGEVTMPQPSLQRALEAVTRLPFVTLCTPEMPPDSSEVVTEISSVVADLNDTARRILRIVSYFNQ